MDREITPTGWSGRFRCFYLNRWLWILGFSASFVLPFAGAIVFCNFFAVENYPL